MPERPHIAMTLTQLWHGVPGGTATSMLRLAGALMDSGQVRLTGVAPLGNLRNPRSFLSSSDAALEQQHLPLVRVPLPLPVLYDSWQRSGLPRIPGTESGATRGAAHLDLVHLTVPVTPPRCGVPLVATVHDLFPLTHPELMSGRGERLMSAGLVATRERASKVFVSTRHVANECLRWGFSASQLELAPFGVEPVHLDEADVQRVREKYRITGPYLLFVGTMEPRKNLGLLVEALVRLDDPELALVLVGPEGWEGRAPRPGWAALEDLPSPTLRLGFVPEEDLAALHNGAVAFCFPSLAEGFGLPVLESMAAGAVVITSDSGATAEVAGDAALLVDPSDPDALVAAIRTVMTDDSASKELRRGAISRSEQFRWSDCADIVADGYRSVLR